LPGKYTTISIPKELYLRLEEIIKGTGFRSPTEYIVYLTRQAVAAIEMDRRLINSMPYTAGDEKAVEEDKSK
jgi:metal-responsive CopG/Arc/MetJ family transcriptional regulator